MGSCDDGQTPKNIAFSSSSQNVHSPDNDVCLSLFQQVNWFLQSTNTIFEKF